MATSSAPRPPGSPAASSTAPASRIRPEEVRELATLARLQLSEDEVAALTQDLDSILGHVAQLGELDTSSVEPMTHAVPFDCPLRVDEVRPSLSLEEALANAPRREASFFEVPRIVPGPTSDAGAHGSQGSEDEP
jgi:aspartyl-tRNA(Asn)/glutamyl-tRNA(Gln) amidotransferase subunit C